MIEKDHIRLYALSLVLGMSFCNGCFLSDTARSSEPCTLMSHYDNVERGIDHLRLWRDLGISSRLFSTNMPITADMFTLGPAGDDFWKMVRLRDLFGDEWQFLLFAHNRSGWAYAGHVDFDNQPFAPPADRLEWNTNGVAKLVIKYVSAYGTELYVEKDAWFALRREGIVKEKETEPTDAAAASLEQ